MMTKKQAIGLMGYLDSLKEHPELCECERCCAKEIPKEKLTEIARGKGGVQNSRADAPDTELDNAEIPINTTSSKAKTLDSRIKSLILEKEGISALLTRRLDFLSASVLRVDATLQTRLNETMK